MKSKLFILYVVLSCSFLLLLISCSEIIEPDLEGTEVELLAPADSVMMTTQTQLFWWEELEKIVDVYNIQIVSPSFDSIVTLIADEDITDSDKFEITLAPGIYEWTVIARNSNSQSQSEIRRLIITDDGSQNLANQTLTLVAPLDGGITNETELTFLWGSLSEAEDYTIQVASPDFSNSTFFVLNERTTDDFYTASSLAEGTYQWRVRAENSSTVSPYSSRSFEIDLTAPSVPVLLNPVDGALVNLPINLEWEVDPSSTMDSIYIYTDPALTNLIEKVGTTATSYIFDDPIFQVYYWRVRSYDQSGNGSSFSETRSFSIL